MTMNLILKTFTALMFILLSMTVKAQKSAVKSKSETSQVVNLRSEIVANEVYSEEEMKTLGDEKTRVDRKSVV